MPAAALRLDPPAPDSVVATAAAPAAAASAPFLRIIEDDESGKLRLEAAVREFRPADAEHPVVYLAAAIHVADRSFYRQLQQFLDSRDVVLFEGVKPPGLGADASVQGDEAKARATARRIRFVGGAVEAYRREHGQYPAALADLRDGAGGLPAELIQRSLKDAWGRELEYAPDGPSKFEITSLGADGHPGGDGPAADLQLSDQKPLSPAEQGARGGIQQQLADAMGLSFQLAVMDHDKSNWRNSDMSIDQLQERLDESGAGDQIFKLLDGSSMFAKFAGFFLGFVKSSPSMQTMMKIMMVELLGQADDLMAAQAGEKMMHVIVKERNAVVIDDLRRIIQDEPGVRSVGIIYGAGHLADLQDRLARLGYTAAGDQWRPAIQIDFAKTGTTAQQARQMRDTLRRQIERQLKAAKTE